MIEKVACPRSSFPWKFPSGYLLAQQGNSAKNSSIRAWATCWSWTAFIPSEGSKEGTTPAKPTARTLLGSWPPPASPAKCIQGRLQAQGNKSLGPLTGALGQSTCTFPTFSTGHPFITTRQPTHPLPFSKLGPSISRRFPAPTLKKTPPLPSIDPSPTTLRQSGALDTTPHSSFFWAGPFEHRKLFLRRPDPPSAPQARDSIISTTAARELVPLHACAILHTRPVAPETSQAACLSCCLRVHSPSLSPPWSLSRVPVSRSS